MAFLSLPMFMWIESMYDANLREERRLTIFDRHAELRRGRAAVKAAIVSYTKQALSLNDSDFIEQYRLSKPLFKHLSEQLEPLLKHSKIKIPLQSKILATLGVYASGDKAAWWKMLDDVLGPAQIASIVCEVTDAINSEGILVNYLGFLQRFEQRNLIKRRFEEKFRLSNVVGYIGCKQIPILWPLFGERKYTNSRGEYSCNVQFICDSDSNIVSVDASHGGATPDAHIWNSHPIKKQLEVLNVNGEVCRLFGDSSYSQSEYVLTSSTSTAEDDHYSLLHAAAQDNFQRTLLSLTNRWRCLLMPEALDFEPFMISNIVKACCALHNMCNGNDFRVTMPRLELEGMTDERI